MLQVGQYFEGFVKGYTPKSDKDPRLWSVEYTDGDREEFNDKELVMYAALFRLKSTTKLPLASIREGTRLAMIRGGVNKPVSKILVGGVRVFKTILTSDSDTFHNHDMH